MASMCSSVLIVLTLGLVASATPLSLLGRGRGGVVQNSRPLAQPSGYNYQTKYFTQKASTNS